MVARLEIIGSTNNDSLRRYNPSGASTIELYDLPDEFRIGWGRGFNLNLPLSPETVTGTREVATIKEENGLYFIGGQFGLKSPGYEERTKRFPIGSGDIVFRGLEDLSTGLFVGRDGVLVNVALKLKRFLAGKEDWDYRDLSLDRLLIEQHDDTELHDGDIIALGVIATPHYYHLRLSNKD